MGVSNGEGFLLKDVNFRVFQGESLVLLGPSGEGKSTLLKIMAGLLDPSVGEVRADGEKWQELTITQRNRHFRKRGMLFQRNALFDSMTSLENVEFPLRETTDLSASEIRSRAEKVLESVGLFQARQQFPSELSGGMQKRLALARALVLQPALLFNDDPVAGLDPITSRKILDLILELKRQSEMTVVSVLNDMNRAYQMATRIWVVMDGKVIDIGTPDQASQFPDSKIQSFLQGEPA
ncbi:MAG: ABC transporter ATP-binding protein [Bdellovibrionales bacterium]